MTVVGRYRSASRMWLAATTVVLGVAAAACSSSGDGQTSNSTKANTASTSGLEKSSITIEAPPTGMSNIFVSIMQDKGFLRQEGLSAKVVSMTPADAMLAIQSGGVNFGVFGATSVIAARIAGRDVRIVANAAEGLPYRIMARPNIKSIDDLKGKAVAIGGASDITDFLLTAALKNAGHDRAYVTVVPTGNGQARLAALQSNSVAAAVIENSDWAKAEAAGMTTVVSSDQFNEIGKGWPFDTWQASESFVKNNPRTTQAFLRAFLKATAYIYDHRDEAVAEAVKAGYKQSDAEADYDYLKNVNTWSKTGRVDPAGVESIVKFGVSAGLLPKVSGKLLTADPYLDQSALDGIK